MKNQTYRMTMLFDFYGEILTERQKEFFDLYYNEDLSLGEIAENSGITRQGVWDGLKKAEAILRDAEARLNLYENYRKRQNEVDFLLARLRKMADEGQPVEDLIASVERMPL